MRWKALAVVLVLIESGNETGSDICLCGPADVTVNVPCPQNLATGQLTVRVTPWLYVRAQGEDATFRLITNRPQENQITIQAKESSDWPYPDRQQSNSNIVLFTGMNGGPGDYQYDIVISCDGEQVVIDPRMKVE